MQEASPTPSPPNPNKSEEESDDTWEDLSCELESQKSSGSGDSKDGENQDNIDVQKLPSFEVLHEYPQLYLNSDFLKKEDQQKTFPFFEDMEAKHRSWMNQMKKQEAKWMSRGFADKRVSTPKAIEKRITFKGKNKKFDGVDFTAGLAVGLLATNAFAFMLGFSLGWFSRDSVPTLAVYEYYMDPNVML